MIIACFDPGNHTGWVLYNTETKQLTGGTFLEHDMYFELCKFFREGPIDIVVYETFNLYPGMAQHLSWNSFYPVEVIGIIKYLCWRKHIEIVGQAPSIKKYAGTIKPEQIREIKEKNLNFTEHTKDALLHLMYYLRNK